MFRRSLIATLVLAAGGAVLLAQDDTRTIIKTETREVLVDAIVTDKKGAVIGDLSTKDFKVWEDGKEQSITNMTFQSDASTNDKRQYMVLFFDNATVGRAEQMSARDAATKFIARNAGPNRLMAVIEFGGAVRITQNFTANVEKLQAAVKLTKGSAINVSTNETVLGMPNLSSAENDFGARSILLALSTVAKNLGTVPGRKSLVLFTSGFPLTPELQSQVTLAINACNRANVAVYPIDARGLVAPSSVGAGGPIGGMAMAMPHDLFRAGAFFFPQAWLGMAFQRPSAPSPSPGGGGGVRSPAPSPTPGGGNTGGGSISRPTPNPGGNVGGGRTTPNFPTNPNTGRTGTNTGNINRQPMPMNFPQDPLSNRIGRILPDIGGVTGNQQVLHLLAEGTGGFVILNSNDILGGLEKIGVDQNAYYVLSYTPPESEEGTCHALKVKVNKGGSNVRARTGYCNAKTVDALAGDSAGKSLEAKLTAAAAGSVPATIELPYFYSAPDTARVNVALEIPYSSLHFDKKKGKFKSSLNILGIAYRDGQVAARFSDTVPFEFDNKKEIEEVSEKQYFYQTQFEIAPGKYTIKVAFDSGDSKFGKLEKPLTVDSWDGKTFFISGIAFAKEIRSLAQMGNALTDAMLDDRKPLVVEGVQITPASRNRLLLSAKANGIYLELYDPLLKGDKPPQIALRIRVLDPKGAEKVDSGLFRIASTSFQAGSPVVPLGLSVPTAGLVPGPYRLEVSAVDSEGNKFARMADVTVE